MRLFFASCIPNDGRMPSGCMLTNWFTVLLTVGRAAVVLSEGRCIVAGCVEELLRCRSNGSVATARSAPVVEPQQRGRNKAVNSHDTECHETFNFFGAGWVCHYPAARIVNEPAPGTQGSSFAKTWYGRGDVLRGETRGSPVWRCMRVRLGWPLVLRSSGTMGPCITLYARHGAYAAGAGCAPVPAPLCELPATYFGRPSLVPRDAYRLI